MGTTTLNTLPPLAVPTTVAGLPAMLIFFAHNDPTRTAAIAAAEEMGLECRARAASPAEMREYGRTRVLVVTSRCGEMPPALLARHVAFARPALSGALRPVFAEVAS